jgi:hypothetical protein
MKTSEEAITKHTRKQQICLGFIIYEDPPPQRARFEQTDKTGKQRILSHRVIRDSTLTTIF